MRIIRGEDHSLILLKQALGFALHGRGVKSLRGFGGCPVKQGLLSQHLSGHFSKFAWLPIGGHYMIAVVISTYYYPELPNIPIPWPLSQKKKGRMLFLLLVAQIQIEEAVIADQLCRSSRLRLTLGESSAIQTKLPANALHTDPKKIIIIFFVFWNQRAG